MKRIFQILGAFLSMWLVGGCAARVSAHRAIPRCGSAEAFVPSGCYSVLQGDKVEVRCPGQTSTYLCGKTN
jgi:hypothetical protein